MRRYSTRVGLVMFAVAVAVAAGCAAPKTDRGVVYQTSTISALLEGVYDGSLTLAELRKHGDFGIGTFDALDGEMVLVDGRFWRVRGDGSVESPPLDETTPFATVISFEAAHTLRADGPFNLADLEHLIDSAIPTRNLPLAVRVTGTFRYVKTRSVPRQTKPYPRLVDVAAKQPTFEFRQVRGTLVGFRLPPYVQEINVPGYHLHFLADDRKGGGHVLELSVEDVVIEVDDSSAIYVALPADEAFGAADLAPKAAGEVERVET